MVCLIRAKKAELFLQWWEISYRHVKKGEVRLCEPLSWLPLDAGASSHLLAFSFFWFVCIFMRLEKPPLGFKRVDPRNIIIKMGNFPPLTSDTNITNPPGTGASKDLVSLFLSLSLSLRGTKAANVDSEWRYGPLFALSRCTEVEIFMENGVRGRAQTAGANSRLSATKNETFHAPLFP